MEGTVDPFDFMLAEALHLTLWQVRRLPNSEVLEWKAFYKWRHEMAELQRQRQGG